MSTSFITPGHVWAFQAVTSSAYSGRINLMNCLINGEPGVAIVIMDRRDDGFIDAMPLFVAITPGMSVEFEGERESDGSGGGPQREFREAQQHATIPTPHVSG